MSTAAVATQVLNENEQAARAPVPTPESGVVAQEAANDAAVNDQSREPAPKPEGMIVQPVPQPPRTPPLSIASLPAANEDAFVSEQVHKAAEKNLADYIGGKVSAHFTNPQSELMLDIIELPAAGSTGIKLCFSSPSLKINHHLFETQVLHALAEHPVLQAALPSGHSTPHASHDKHEAANSMVHIHIPGLTAGQYKHILSGLAAQPVVQKAETVADQAPVQTTADAAIAASAAVPQAAIPVTTVQEVASKEPLAAAPEQGIKL